MTLDKRIDDHAESRFWSEPGTSFRTSRSWSRGHERPSLEQSGREMFTAASPFTGLGEDILAALRRIAVRRSFSGGQTIHLQDDDARFLNVVAAGHIRLSYVMEDGSGVLHDILPRGETFGELGVFDQSSYPDMATAAGPVWLLSIPTTGFHDLAALQPDLLTALHRAVAVRYRDYIALVRDLSFQSLSARLARTIVRVADRLGAAVEHEGRPVLMINSLVTQTDLGSMARGSRGNVNRALRAWQSAGLIELKDRSILLLDRTALVAWTTDDRD